VLPSPDAFSAGVGVAKIVHPYVDVGVRAEGWLAAFVEGGYIGFKDGDGSGFIRAGIRL
jgi:hypothetical protein